MSKVVSAARVVGRISPPPGRSWDELIASAAERAQLIVDFHTLAAQALGLRLREVQIHHRLWMPGLPRGGEKESAWHCDGAKQGGHVLCVAGEVPTEFLIGVYEHADPDQPFDIDRLSETMMTWSPEPGELVLYDRFAIHRRPPVLGERNRIFLLCSPV